MLITKGIKLRLYPNQKQQKQLRQLFGNDRKLWNMLLDMANQRYDNNPHSQFLDNYQMDRLLPLIKQEYDYFKLSDSSSLQLVTRTLNQAFQMLFKHRGGHPQFHSYKSTKQSYTGKSTVKVIAKRYLKLPKLGCIKTSKTGRLLNGKIKQYTVALLPTGRYQLSVILECESQTLPKTGRQVGLDLGLSDLIIKSDPQAEQVKIDKFTTKHLDTKARHWQRKFSRRKYQATVTVRQFNHNHPELPEIDLNDYSNWRRAQIRKARLQDLAKRKREAYLQQVTTQLVKDYDTIVIEDLKAKNMMKNHNLADSIAHACWRKIRDMLTYKCQWYGKQLIIVNPRNTSRICHTCGRLQQQFKNLSQDEWLNAREWNCEQCGCHQDRDINAAINILNRGLTTLSNN